MSMSGSGRDRWGQVPVYPLDYRSSFLCPTLVNPGLVAVGHRVCGGPRAAPPGEVAASGLGASPGIAPGLASHIATARSPGRQPFWPTQSHLLHPMTLQWPERAERALSTPNQNRWCSRVRAPDREVSRCPFRRLPLPSVARRSLHSAVLPLSSVARRSFL